MYGTCTYIWLILMVNVGKSTSPMDGMGDAKLYFLVGKSQPPNPSFALGGLIQHIPPLEREKQQHRSKSGILAKKMTQQSSPTFGGAKL